MRGGRAPPVGISAASMTNCVRGQQRGMRRGGLVPLGKPLKGKPLKGSSSAGLVAAIVVAALVLVAVMVYFSYSSSKGAAYTIDDQDNVVGFEAVEVAD